jgi:hypothetical protein
MSALTSFLSSPALKLAWGLLKPVVEGAGEPVLAHELAKLSDDELEVIGQAVADAKAARAAA